MDTEDDQEIKKTRSTKKGRLSLGKPFQIKKKKKTRIEGIKKKTTPRKKTLGKKKEN